MLERLSDYSFSSQADYAVGEEQLEGQEANGNDGSELPDDAENNSPAAKPAVGMKVKFDEAEHGFDPSCPDLFNQESKH